MQKFISPIAAAIVFFGIYFIIVILSGYGINLLKINWDFSTTGEFGDSFGLLSSLMATVAAVAAIFTYRSQSEELNRVKSEADEEKSARTIRDFEQNFFNLLSLFRETVKEIVTEDIYNGNPQSGRDGIRQILSSHIGSSTGNDDMDQKIYMKTYSKFQDDLGHYFRLFYNILRFIDESPVPEKMRYTRLLRATMSEAEISIISLNCLFGGGDPKLKRLVEKYAMLHNISMHYLTMWRMNERFSKTAFGDRDITEDKRLLR